MTVKPTTWIILAAVAAVALFLILRKQPKTKTLADKVKAYLGKIGGAVVGALGGAYGGVKSVGRTAENVGSAATGAVGAAGSAVTGVVSGGAGAIEGIGNGIVRLF